MCTYIKLYIYNNILFIVPTVARAYVKAHILTFLFPILTIYDIQELRLRFCSTFEGVTRIISEFYSCECITRNTLYLFTVFLYYEMRMTHKFSLYTDLCT